MLLSYTIVYTIIGVQRTVRKQEDLQTKECLARMLEGWQKRGKQRLPLFSI